MSDNTGASVPQNIQPIGDLVPDLPGSGGHGLPPSLQILLNEGLYNRIKQLSGVMANARGMTPAHLLDKPEACFSVICMSLDWKLSPHFVARHTYQTPGGAIGFDGALVHAVLEQSGRFIGAPQMEYRGDWNSLVGKFELKTGGRGGTYPAPTWTSKDAIGLGVIVRWRVKGEPEPRVWPGEDNPFWLHQCFPLNSPLWATDPKTQIAYLAIRRFANLTSPGILGAAAFDQDELLDASERAIDVTEPRRDQFNASRRVEPVDERPEFAVIDNDGVEHILRVADKATLAIAAVLREAAFDLARLDGAWESNQATIERLAQQDADSTIELAEQYEAYRKDLTSRPVVEPSTAAERPGAEMGTEGDRGADPISRRGDDPKPATEAPAAATAPPFPGDLPSSLAPPPSAQQPSRAIAPPMRSGKADWRTWAVALMSSKVRQQKTTVDLATLLGDNEEHLEEARRALADGPQARTIADLDKVIDAQWAAIDAAGS